MSETLTPHILQEEYEIYTSMFNEAKAIDGPDSPITLFTSRLVNQVAQEIAAVQRLPAKFQKSKAAAGSAGRH